MSTLADCLEHLYDEQVISDDQKGFKYYEEVQEKDLVLDESSLQYLISWWHEWLYRAETSISSVSVDLWLCLVESGRAGLSWISV